MSKINQKVLMSGADYFSVIELNPYEHGEEQPDRAKAITEHAKVKAAIESTGIEVISVAAPENCQDGVYTANWGLCWKGKAVLSFLPNPRQAEESYAKAVIENLGYETIKPNFRFSGQGDCLPCGDYLFVGSRYRTDIQMHHLLGQLYGCKIVGLETVPALDVNGSPIINRITGWPDSYFYDLDLALAVITPELIAWCPEAFQPASRQLIESLSIEKINVTMTEAMHGFACNLVSSGTHVVMSAQAPKLQSELEKRGFKTITPTISELNKGGGYIRCCSLTLA
ncbi:arginine deiminase-related protein [Patescibacteria group bacterium]|nr:arginine deiminase-related protein [Patescibacteria group bacterium]